MGASERLRIKNLRFRLERVKRELAAQDRELAALGIEAGADGAGPACAAERLDAGCSAPDARSPLEGPPPATEPRRGHRHIPLAALRG